MSDEERILAEVAQVRLLDKIAQKLEKLELEQTETRKLLESTIPEGIVEPLDVTVTTEQQTVQPPHVGAKWFSVSVVNDGDNDCYIVLNTEKSSTTPYLLQVDETFEVDLGVPKIRDLMVWTESGTAVLRVRGVR